jgi:DNA-binding transcriptional ArsR family regulator
MSIMLVGNLIEKTGPRDAAQLNVMVALANRADKDGVCWPSIATISFESRMSERSVQRHLKVLERLGWLVIMRGSGAGRWSRYRLNVDRIMGKELRAEKGDTVSPISENKRVTELHQKGDKRYMKRVTNDAFPLYIEPSVEPSKEPSLNTHEPSPSLAVCVNESLAMQSCWVCDTCGWVDASLRALVERLVDAAVVAGRFASVEDAAQAMAFAAIAYRENTPWLRYPYGIVKFLEQGHWLAPESWRWDGDAGKRRGQNVVASLARGWKAAQERAIPTSEDDGLADAQNFWMQAWRKRPETLDVSQLLLAEGCIEACDAERDAINERLELLRSERKKVV